MRTLDEVVQSLADCGKIDCNDCLYHENRNGIDIDHCQDMYDDALAYLRQYQDARHILTDDRIVSYWGRLPVIKIGDEYYAVRNYVKRQRGWRCNKLSADEYGWYTADDENYIIDKDGNIICKEYGWDLREEPYESIRTEVHKARGCA